MKPVLILIVLFFINPIDVNAKKSGKSFSSKSFSSYKSTTKKSNKSYDTSFKSSYYDKARSKSIEKAKSTTAYKNYKKEREKFNDKSVKVVTNSDKVKLNVKPEKYYENKYNYYQKVGTLPQYTHRNASSFGLWDAVFLWALLANNPLESANFVYNHQNDSGVQEWLKVANEESKNNLELRENLKSMQSGIDDLESKNVKLNPSYIPANLKDKSVAYSEEALFAKNSNSGFSISSIIYPFLILFIGYWLIFVRKY